MIKMLVRQCVWITAVLGVSGIAWADAGCTLATLRGSYLLSATGFTLVAGVQQPKAIVELISFKGDGTLTVPGGTRSVNGVITRILPGGTGKYTVDGGCTGTIAFDGGPSFDTILSVQGGKFHLIQSNTDNVFEGTLESAPTVEPACSNETLKGSYGVLLTGSRPAPSVAPGQPGFVGQFEQVYGTVVQIYDGQGNFTQVDNVKGTVSGITPDRPGQGTYTVNADCSFTNTVQPGPGITIVTKGVLFDSGKQFHGNTITPSAINVASLGHRM